VPSMPYHLEKGPTLSVLEDYLDDDARLVAAINYMRPPPLGPGGAIADMVSPGAVFLNSNNLNGGPNPTLADRVRYINEEWLGMSEVGGNWVPQGLFGPAHPTTRAWSRWYGDADSILRETFIRAGEMALGIDHDRPTPALPLPRGVRKRIQILWKCAQPWFEGWVTWRPDSVTVILCTPGSGAPVWTSPDPYTPQPGPPDFKRDPGVYPPRFGMIVVTHEHNRPTLVPTTTGPTSSGVVNQPFHVWVGRGPVIAVQTAERDGGVLHEGRPY
jgi:hypothetical protein